MIDEFIAALPKHKGGLYIEHNPHKGVYMDVEQWIIDNDWCDWENDESKQRASETDEIWIIQWYPSSPVSFYSVAAPTLQDALRLAAGVDEDKSK